VRDTLAFLDKFEPNARARVMARVPAASREVIENTPRTGWVSIEHDHWTVDAMVEIFGAERATQCWREALAYLVERPLLRNFVVGMMNVLGRSPIAVVRLFAKGWPLVYQDLTDPQLIATPDGRPTIRFADISPAVQRYPNYLLCWHGVCQGFATLAGVRGHVSFEVAPDVTWAEAKFYWEESSVSSH